MGHNKGLAGLQEVPLPRMHTRRNRSQHYTVQAFRFPLGRYAQGRLGRGLARPRFPPRDTARSACSRAFPVRTQAAAE